MIYIIDPETYEIYAKFQTKNIRAVKLIAKRLNAVIRQIGEKMQKQLSQSSWKTVAQKRERDSIELIREIRGLRIEKAQGKVYEEDSERMHRFDNFKSPFAWK